MTTEKMTQVCLAELLRGEMFLMRYEEELEALAENPAFVQIINSICQQASSDVIFNANKKDPDHDSFKRQYLYDIFVVENLDGKFPAYRRIISSVRSQGDTLLSAVISIFYGVKYLMLAGLSHNNDTKIAQTPESDLDFRKRWPAQYRCDDGHYVRSKNEQLVDNWLYHHNICHAYEVLVKDRKNNVEYISDFYLPQLDTYMEIWGFETPEYLSRKKAKTAAYKNNGLKLIEMTNSEIKILDDYLRRTVL